MRKKPKTKIPAVRMAKPAGRPIQLRYTDPATGKEVRISTKTTDEGEALSQLDTLKAKLTLGIDARPRPAVRHDGPSMLWEEFRDNYSRLKVATFRSAEAMRAAELRLDVCARIVGPRTLGDMAKPSTLARLQAELLAGAESQRKLPRSAHSVLSYLKALFAALNWAGPGRGGMKWLPERVEFPALDVDEPDKGRPITTEELERMLAAVPKVVGDVAAESWRYLLRGLWESGLRLSEAMMVSWDTDGGIVPEWPARGLPVLHIPAKLQKNRKAQDVPMTPEFAALLLETPEAERKGWIFSPQARQGGKRLTAEKVGRRIGVIGRRANVAVNAAGKPATAHDLRRGFCQRMADAGLPVRDLQVMVRHSSIATTEAFYLRDRVQDQAQRIARYLKQGKAHASSQTRQADEATNPA